MRHTQKASQSGFSLVELSIVLVILGLLTGGILGGQSLIRAAELRKITSEHQGFEVAINTFHSKYRSLPGDFKKAEQVWGAASNCPEGSDVGTETCNGNGNGSIDEDESFRFWQHLSNAQLIPGRYLGLAPSEVSDWTPAEHFPDSASGNGAWIVYTGPAIRRSNGNTANVWMLATVAPWGDFIGSLSSEELWSIDAKIDDGMPTSGVVQTAGGGDGTTGNTGPCIDDTTSPVEYDLGASNCILFFPRKEFSSDWGFNWEGENLSWAVSVI